MSEPVSGSDEAKLPVEGGQRVPREVLECDGISKVFEGTQALDGVSIRVMSGQVHGLVGQNGSGKSTLVKILAGYHEPDPGARIVIDGTQVTQSLGGGRSRGLGLRFVHQDLGVVPQLSVTENLFVDRFVAEPQSMLRWHDEHAKASALLHSFGVDVDPRRAMGELPTAVQAMVVIVRAAEGLQGDSAKGSRRGILILDEATATLPLAARRQLRAVVGEVVALGHGVLFVSHFPDEVLDWAEYVTVLRDGRVVADRSTSGMSEDELVELIIGRRLEALQASYGGLPTVEDGTAAVLSVSGVDGNEVTDLSFDVMPGEVLGITGLVGSGYDEACRLLGGAAEVHAGTLELEGRRWQLVSFSPIDASRAGISLVTQDRLSEGIAPTLTVAENISLPILDRYSGRGGRIRHGQLGHEVARLLREYNVQPPDPTLNLGGLSGGNQQKVVIAKAMAGQPKVLALIEPTTGVDVGARSDILTKLREVARDGTAVVCGSTDSGQLAQLCDRVIVLQRGRVVAELRGDDINQDRIVHDTYRSVA